MRRLAITIATAAYSLVQALGAEPGSFKSFDKRLPRDSQIVHVLNRLTFGPRPGDVEEVRRMGLEKWIAAQLHPERVGENPALDAKLQPFETLRLNPEAIIKEYPLLPAGLRLNLFRPLTEFLTPDEIRRQAPTSVVANSAANSSEPS